MEIERLDADAAADAVPALAALLIDAVDSGASLGFLRGIEQDEAQQFWRESVVPRVRAGTTILLAAFDDDALLGTIQLRLAELPNARHRAEVSKLLVHTAARRRGVGRALLSAAEDAARGMDRTLLVLDTIEGTPAEELYRAAGYLFSGTIPAYAAMPDGMLAPTAIFYRHLALVPGAESLRIRSARVADAARMGEIHVAAWQASYRGAMPDEFLAGLDPGLRVSQWREGLTYARATDRHWVIERDGEVVGFAHTGTSRDSDAVTGSAEVFAIYLQPELVGTGLGRALLDHAVTDLRRRGARWVTAWVFDGGSRARHVLEAAGLRPDGGGRTFTVLGEPMREIRYRLTVTAPG